MHNTKSIKNIPNEIFLNFSGETITELLFAILITCLGVLIFFTMITTSFNLIRAGVSADTKYRDNLNSIESFLAGESDQSTTSSHISISTDISTDTFNKNMKYDEGSGIPVTTFSAGSSNTEIKVYRYDQGYDY